MEGYVKKYCDLIFKILEFLINLPEQRRSPVPVFRFLHFRNGDKTGIIFHLLDFFLELTRIGHSTGSQSTYLGIQRSGILVICLTVRGVHKTVV